MTNDARQPFDAHQYAIDGGWSIDEIRATAEHGVSDEDASRITQYYGDGDESEKAMQHLKSWCVRKSTEVK